MDENQDKVLISRKKWMWLGVLVALVNPIFSGLILGAVYLSEPELKHQGQVISAIAILWGAFLYYFVSQNLAINPFGF